MRPCRERPRDARHREVASIRAYVIMTCHNRRDLTVRAVRAAVRSAGLAGIDVSFTVFDDGSNDGTGEALTAVDADVTVIKGDGSFFWAAGMARAEGAVLDSKELSERDLVVWLNDDVELRADAFDVALRHHEVSPDAVLVGSTTEPLSTTISYSGMRRKGRHPLSFEIVNPGVHAAAVDTFNGNFVVVPVSTARELGGIDGRFAHAFADIDYGLRCKSRNVPVLLLPTPIGTCARDAPMGPQTALGAWRNFTGRKGGGNLDSLRIILVKRHPFTWPIFVAITYSKWWVTRILQTAVQLGRRQSVG